VAPKFDIVDATKKYKGDLHEFYLDMTAWRSFKSRYKLQWQKVQFGGTDPVPSEPGIYAFTVEFSPSKLPQHGYIMYIGITGDGASRATLKSRYRQYIRHAANGGGRPRVLYMLQNWQGDLWFNYATFKSPNIDLGKLERDMLSAVIPPINLSDLAADVARARKAKF